MQIQIGTIIIYVPTYVGTYVEFICAYPYNLIGCISPYFLYYIPLQERGLRIGLKSLQFFTNFIKVTLVRQKVIMALREVILRECNAANSLQTKVLSFFISVTTKEL